ncbi:MAG: DUF1579 domain-containing protein [Phycisphaerae bacterium]
MNKRFWCGAIVAGLATAAITGQVLSQNYDDKKPGAGHGEMDMEAVMKEWMALSQPGKMHKFLQGMAGTWDAKAKMWMGGPGTPATESTGRQITKSVLGGRFILDTYVGEFKMPGPDGEMQTMPFEGIGITGYDNFRNMFVATWADNMGTPLHVMKGNLDQSGKVLTMYGEMDEPSLKITGRLVKYVTRIINDDKYVFEMFDLHAGDGYKVMEITYTRS